MLTIDQYQIGLDEALRLNRIHANEYRRYRYALKKHLRLKQESCVQIQGQVVTKDKRNVVIDELTAIANYIYTNPKTGKETILPKHYIKKAIEDAIQEGYKRKEQEKAKLYPYNLPQKPQVDPEPQEPLTQERLQQHLYYDLEEGTFEWQTGSLAGKRAGSITMPPSKPPKQYNAKGKANDKSKLPRKPVSPSGYYIVSEEAYLTAQAQNPRQTDIYRLFYAKKAPQGATDELIRVPYYLKKSRPSIRIVLLGREYSASQLAYLYMGAGGDWNYTRGIDNAYRVNTTIAPEGLKLYDHKTNKPRRKPCRDGDPLNLRWDNIKPDAVSTATITKDPTVKREGKPPSKRVYGHTRNIKHIKGQWVVQGVVERGKIPDFYAWSEADAIREFEKRVAKLKGFKQKLRNGDILVTKKQVSRAGG